MYGMKFRKTSGLSSTEVSLAERTIDRHISKSITNYNALGTATFIVAYVNSANFEAFWERYSEHILHYDFPLQIKENFSPLVHPNAATRIASMILTRDGFDFPVYFIALKIS